MVPFTGAAGWDDKAYHAKVSLILAAGYIREYPKREGPGSSLALLTRELRVGYSGQ
jgi:hypothetical protein